MYPFANVVTSTRSPPTAASTAAMSLVVATTRTVARAEAAHTDTTSITSVATNKPEHAAAGHRDGDVSYVCVMTFSDQYACAGCDPSVKLYCRWNSVNESFGVSTTPVWKRRAPNSLGTKANMNAPRFVLASIDGFR